MSQTHTTTLQLSPHFESNPRALRRPRLTLFYVNVRAYFTRSPASRSSTGPLPFANYSIHHGANRRTLNSQYIPVNTGACTKQQLEVYCASTYVVHKYLSYRLNHDNQKSNVGPKVPQAHTRHHHQSGVSRISVVRLSGGDRRAICTNCTRIPVLEFRTRISLDGV